MKNQRWLIVIGVVIVLAVGAWFIFAKPGAPTTATSPSPSAMASMSMAPQTSSSNSSASNPVPTSNISISDFAFSPDSITIKKGTKVTWTNQDTTAHTVQETDGLPGPKSATLNKGVSYSYTYKNTGTFHYDCSIHPYMTGTVIVTD